MADIMAEIDKVRKTIRARATNQLLKQKPFANGMYRFSMFMIEYYSRVRDQLNMDYDSFMIVQTVVSHSLYTLQKKTNNISYSELETEWEKLIYSEDDVLKRIIQVSNRGDDNNKLSISSICLITKLPKETVRRKVIELNSKGILKTTKDKGIVLGRNYKEIFQDFVPSTVLSVSKLLKKWEKDGVLKYLLSFQVKND